jgi:hypothetical protein
MEILEDIAPTAARGKEISKMITVSGCNKFQTLEYDHVSITRSTHEMRATAVKREVCRTLPNK